MDGEDIDWMEALGSGVKGAITGATQAGLLASGAGFPTALFANALAGTAGSAAEQYIGGGRIDPEKSILGGLSNAVSNAIYGTDPLGSGKEAFLRGMGDGAANAALSYLFDRQETKGCQEREPCPDWRERCSPPTKRCATPEEDAEASARSYRYPAMVRRRDISMRCPERGVEMRIRRRNSAYVIFCLRQS